MGGGGGQEGGERILAIANFGCGQQGRQWGQRGGRAVVGARRGIGRLRAIVDQCMSACVSTNVCACAHVSCAHARVVVRAHVCVRAVCVRACVVCARVHACEHIASLSTHAQV